MCVCSYQLCLTSALQANNLLHVARFAAGPSAATTSQSSRPASFCGGWSSGSTCFHSQRQPPGCRIYTCHVLEPLLLETRWCYSRSYTQRPSSTQSSTTTPLHTTSIASMSTSRPFILAVHQVGAQGCWAGFVCMWQCSSRAQE